MAAHAHASRRAPIVLGEKSIMAKRSGDQEQPEVKQRPEHVTIFIDNLQIV